MRVLAVTPYYDPEGGGLERYARSILSRLAARGHEVDVLCCTRGASGSEIRDGVEVQRRRPTLSLGNAPVDLGFASAVARHIEERRPDVVVAHTPVPFPAEMAYLAARRAGVPFVTTYHAGRLQAASPVFAGLAALDRWTLERAMLKGSDRLIAVTAFVRDRALAAQKQKVSIIPPGVDASRFRPGVPSDGRTVLFVGPLSRSYRWKGLDVLLQAFPLIRERHPEARLALVGDGDRAAGLRRQADRSGGSLALLGRLTDERLAAAYQQAAVVVLPSITEAESFGMVLAEANACGRPVVASRIGGIPCFVRDGDNGRLATPGDPRDLAEKVVGLLQDPAMADELGERGRRRVLEEHEWDRLTLDTERVLESAVRARGRPRASGAAQTRGRGSADARSLQRRLA